MPTDDRPDKSADQQTAFHQLSVKKQRQVFAYILTLLPPVVGCRGGLPADLRGDPG